MPSIHAPERGIALRAPAKMPTTRNGEASPRPNSTMMRTAMPSCLPMMNGMIRPSAGAVQANASGTTTSPMTNAPTMPTALRPAAALFRSAAGSWISNAPSIEAMSTMSTASRMRM